MKRVEQYPIIQTCFPSLVTYTLQLSSLKNKHKDKERSSESRSKDHKKSSRDRDGERRHRDKDKERSHHDRDRHREKDRDRKREKKQTSSIGLQCDIGIEVKEEVKEEPRLIFPDGHDDPPSVRLCGYSLANPLHSLAGIRDYKYAHMLYLELYANGGGKVLHAWQEDVDKLSEKESWIFAEEFLKEAFIEVDGLAMYCAAIVHNAAKGLPDFLEYLGDEHPNLPVKHGIIGRAVQVSFKLKVSAYSYHFGDGYESQIMRAKLQCPVLLFSIESVLLCQSDYMTGKDYEERRDTLIATNFYVCFGISIRACLTYMILVKL